METVRVRNMFGKMLFRSRLSQNRILRLSVLSIALEKVLSVASPQLRSQTIRQAEKTNLCPALAHVSKIFVENECNGSIREVALHRTVRLICLVCDHAQCFPTPLDTTLHELLANTGLSVDIRIDAARAIVGLSLHPEIKKHPRSLQLMVSSFSLVASTLTTSLYVATRDQADEIVESLYRLTRSSRTARAKISERSDNILAIVSLLEQDRLRICVLKMAALLLRCRSSVDSLQLPYNSGGSTLFKALARVALAASDSSSQSLAIAILAFALFTDGWDPPQIRLIVTTFFHVVVSDTTEGICIMCAKGICRFFVETSDTDDIAEFVPSFLGMVGSLHQTVRREALETLTKCADESAKCSLFMTNPNFLRTLAGLIHSGNRHEREASIRILQLCAREPRNSTAICCNSSLMSSLVDTAVTGKLANRDVYLQYVELVLLIVSDSTNHFYLVNHTELLPWLATFANAMTSNGVLKQQVVRAIVQLSKSFLERGVPNRVLV